MERLRFPIRTLFVCKFCKERFDLAKELIEHKRIYHKQEVEERMNQYRHADELTNKDGIDVSTRSETNTVPGFEPPLKPTTSRKGGTKTYKCNSETENRLLTRPTAFDYDNRNDIDIRHGRDIKHPEIVVKPILLVSKGTPIIPPSITEMDVSIGMAAGIPVSVNAIEISLSLPNTPATPPAPKKKKRKRLNTVAPSIFRTKTKYACRYCPQVVHGIRNRNQHEITHTSAFKCPECKIGFPSQEILFLHLTESHLRFQPTDNVVVPSSWKCSECIFIGCSEKSIRDHHKIIHTNKVSGTISGSAREKTRKIKKQPNGTSPKSQMKMSVTPSKPTPLKSRKKQSVTTTRGRPTILCRAKCEQCNIQFGGKTEYIAHIELVHPEKKIYKCFQCVFVTVKYSTFWFHNRRKHPGNNIRKCSKSPISVANHGKLQKNITHSHPDPDIQSIKVNLPKPKRLGKTRTRKRVKVKVGKKEKQTPVKESKFKAPIKSPRNSSVEFPAHCDRCDYASTSRRSMQRHFDTVHSSQRRGDFQCLICQSTFPKAGHLKNHMTRNHVSLKGRSDSAEIPVAEQPEEIPREETVSAEQIKPAQKSMCNGKAFACTICDEKFTVSEELILHSESDCNEIKTKGKSFGDSSPTKINILPTSEAAINVKIEIEDEEPDVIFLEEVQKPPPPPLAPLPPITKPPCFFCGLVFAFPSHLKAHFDEVHGLSSNGRNR